MEEREETIEWFVACVYVDVVQHIGVPRLLVMCTVPRTPKGGTELAPSEENIINNNKNDSSVDTRSL